MRQAYIFAALAMLAVGQAATVRPNFPTRLPRTITFTEDVGNHGWVLRAVNVVSKGVGSALSFWLTTLGFPRLRANYFAKSTDAATALSYRTGLFALAEYNDTGPHDIRGVNAAKVVQYLRMVDEAGWSPMTHVLSQVNGINVHTLSTTLTTTCTKPVTCTGTITVLWVGRISEQTVQLDLNTTLAPNVLKFDLTIDWPFLRTGTKLGIVVGVMSAEAFIDGTNPVPLTTSSENGIEVGSDPNSMFSWATEVAANFPSSPTSNVPLLQSPLWSDVDFANFTTPNDNDVQANEQHHGFFFTFDSPGVAGQTGSFFWDPSSSLSDTAGAASLAVSVLTVLVSLVAGVAAQRTAF